MTQPRSPGVVPATDVIGGWEAPVEGVIRDRLVYDLGTKALWDAKNVQVRLGKLRERPGFNTSFCQSNFITRPTGALWAQTMARPAFQPNAFQSSGFQTSPQQQLLIVGTAEGLMYVKADGTLGQLMPAGGNVFQGNLVQANMVQGSSLQKRAGDADHPTRFAMLQYGSTIYVLAADGVNAPMYWDEQATSFQYLTGAPVFSDVIATDDRFVGIVPPYGIFWGTSINNVVGPLTFPALNTQLLAGTTDKMVAIRDIGTLAFVVYKEKTIWLAVAQGGSDAQWFRFNMFGYYDGPASPMAVVNANGTHVYMTKTGRVGVFTGSSHRWALDGCWPALRDGTTAMPKLDQDYANRAFGVYHQDFDEVWFHYPQVGDNGQCYGLLIVSRPQVEQANGVVVPIYAGFTGRTAVPFACGAERGSLTTVRLSSDTNYAAYLEGGLLDAGLPYPILWQSGMMNTPDGQAWRLEGFEMMAERAAGNGVMTAKIMHSFQLEQPDGDPGASNTVDLTKVYQSKEQWGGDVRGRYFAFRGEAQTPVTIRWYGGRLAGIPVERRK